MSSSSDVAVSTNSAALYDDSTIKAAECVLQSTGVDRETITREDVQITVAESLSLTPDAQLEVAVNILMSHSQEGADLAKSVGTLSNDEKASGVIVAPPEQPETTTPPSLPQQVVVLSIIEAVQKFMHRKLHAEIASIIKANGELQSPLKEILETNGWNAATDQQILNNWEFLADLETQIIVVDINFDKNSTRPNINSAIRWFTDNLKIEIAHLAGKTKFSAQLRVHRAHEAVIRKEIGDTSTIAIDEEECKFCVTYPSAVPMSKPETIKPDAQPHKSKYGIKWGDEEELRGKPLDIMLKVHPVRISCGEQAAAEDFELLYDYVMHRSCVDAGLRTHLNDKGETDKQMCCKTAVDFYAKYDRQYKGDHRYTFDNYCLLIQKYETTEFGTIKHYEAGVTHQGNVPFNWVLKSLKRTYCLGLICACPAALVEALGVKGRIGARPYHAIHGRLSPEFELSVGVTKRHLFDRKANLNVMTECTHAKTGEKYRVIFNLHLNLTIAPAGVTCTLDSGKCPEGHRLTSAVLRSGKKYIFQCDKCRRESAIAWQCRQCQGYPIYTKCCTCVGAIPFSDKNTEYSITSALTSDEYKSLTADVKKKLNSVGPFQPRSGPEKTMYDLKSVGLSVTMDEDKNPLVPLAHLLLKHMKERYIDATKKSIKTPDVQYGFVVPSSEHITVGGDVVNEARDLAKKIEGNIHKLAPSAYQGAHDDDEEPN